MSTKIQMPTGKAVTPAPTEVNPEPGTNTLLTIQYQPAAPQPPEVTGADFTMRIDPDRLFMVNGNTLNRAEFWQLMNAGPLQPIAVHGATVHLIPEG